jgi:hypothetical protein
MKKPKAKKLVILSLYLGSGKFQYCKPLIEEAWQGAKLGTDNQLANDNRHRQQQRMSDNRPATISNQHH